MKILPLLLLLLSVSPAFAFSDDEDADGDGVAAVLERAVHFQRGDEVRARPETFHGRFYVTVRNRDGQTFNAEVERYYTRRPERMVTTRVDSIVETNSTVGWDEGTAWFRDNKTGRVIIYSDDPEAFDVDLEQLDFQLLITPLILDAAVLDSLLPRLENISLGGEAVYVDIDGDGHVVDVVQAEMVDDLFPPDPDSPPPAPDDPLPRLAVQLQIDRDTGALWALHLETLGATARRSLAFAFNLHEMTPSGLRVPANIEVFEDGRAQPSVMLGVLPVEVQSSDEELVSFEVDVPVEAQRFEVPEES